MGWGGVFPAGIRPDSPSRGPFACLAMEVGLGQNHGVRLVHEPRRTSSFYFCGYGRLVYAEAGNAMAGSLVGRLSLCKRATARTISGEKALDLTMSEGSWIVDEEGSAEPWREKL